MSEKVKNNITELVFIIDRSGSMAGLETDTIGGFNSMIKKQKSEEGKCYVSTVLFDDKSEVIHDRVDINDVEPITEKEYYVRGSTALIDAMGDAIHHIANIHKYARKEDVPEHTMFVITTDGAENASHKYSSDDVKKMVEKEKEKYGWEFIFIGANIDSVETAKHYGIDRNHAVDYVHDEIGTAVMYENISHAVTCKRKCASPSVEWRENIEADFKKRSKKK